MQEVRCCKACAEKYRWLWKGPSVFSICDLCKSEIFIKKLGTKELKEGTPLELALNPIKYDEVRYKELKELAERNAMYIDTLGTFEYGLSKNLHNEALHAAKLALYNEIKFDEIYKYEIFLKLDDDKVIRTRLRNRYIHFRKIDDEIGEINGF